MSCTPQGSSKVVFAQVDFSDKLPLVARDTVPGAVSVSHIPRLSFAKLGSSVGPSIILEPIITAHFGVQCLESTIALLDQLVVA